MLTALGATRLLERLVAPLIASDQACRTDVGRILGSSGERSQEANDAASGVRVAGATAQRGDR